MTYWQSAQSALARSDITLDARAPVPGPTRQSAGSGPPPAALQRVRAAIDFWHWLRAHVGEYDVLHIHGVFSWPLALGARAARAAGVPYVVSTHGHLYPWSLSQKRWRKSVYLAVSARAQLRKASRIVATCDREAEILRAFDKNLRITVAAPGLPDPAIRNPVARRTGRPAVMRLVFVNRIAPQKGLPVLLHALAILLNRNIPVELDLIGDGDQDYKGRMLALHDKLALGKAVHWHGFLTGPAKEEVLCRADLFVLPSNMENFSFATAEALAAGMPVVVSDAVALADEVRRHDCGTVVPTGDDVKLANAISAYLDPALRTRHANNAVQCAKAAFSIQAMAASLRDLYTTTTMESHG